MMCENCGNNVIKRINVISLGEDYDEWNFCRIECLMNYPNLEKFESSKGFTINIQSKEDVSQEVKKIVWIFKVIKKSMKEYNKKQINSTLNFDNFINQKSLK